MSAAVQKAQAWADALLFNEMCGPGDLLPAMGRVARRIGISKNVLWGLRYRPPKDVKVSVYECLRMAHEAEVRRQAQRIEHELEIARETGADEALVRAAAAADRASLALAGVVSPAKTAKG